MLNKYVLRIYRVADFPVEPTAEDEEALAYAHLEAPDVERLARRLARHVEATVMTPNAVHYPPQDEA